MNKLKIFTKRMLITLAVIFTAIILFFVIFRLVTGNDPDLNRLIKHDTYLQKSVMLGELVGTIDDELDDRDPKKEYIIIIEIDYQWFFVNNKSLYDDFLYNNKRTELFIVYDKIVQQEENDTRPPILVERSIFSVFQ